jgi:Thioesterase-like superfamily
VPRVAAVGTPELAGSYYVPLPDRRYQPTIHVQGAWNEHEQHMGPVSGLVAHAIDQHEPRAELTLARICYDILGVIPAEPTAISVETIRPGRTIELVEATLVAGGRPVVRARAWRMARGDTSAVAGGQPEPLPPPDSFSPWDGRSVWTGGYIASLHMRGHQENSPGRGRGWIHANVSLVEGVDVSPTAAYLGLVDTANGIVVREDPRAWMFPNIDLTVHLFREPVAGWVGFDTTVVFGSGGLGVTSSTLYDLDGPVGRAEQSLTVRPLTPPGT